MSEKKFLSWLKKRLLLPDNADPETYRIAYLRLCTLFSNAEIGSRLKQLLVEIQNNMLNETSKKGEHQP